MKNNVIWLLILISSLFGCRSVQPEVNFTPVPSYTIQPTKTAEFLPTPIISPTSTSLEITTISEGNRVIINGFHPTIIRWLFWSKDGKKLFIGTQDKGVVIYDMINKKMSANFENDSIIAGLALSPDENIFAIAISGDDFISLIDSETGKLIRTLHISQYWPSALSFSPDSKVLASYNDRYKETILWDVATGKEIKRLKNSAVRWFSFDGKSFATSSSGDIFNLWDTNNWELQETVRCKILGISSFSPNKNRFAVIEAETKEVSTWDFKSCKKLVDLSKTQPGPYSITYSTNGEYIAAGGFRGNDGKINSVTIWDANTGKHIRDLVAIQHYDVTIMTVAFNSDGSKLASVAQSEGAGAVIIWDLAQQ
jgi:WD40 repeat protein